MVALLNEVGVDVNLLHLLLAAAGGAFLLVFA